MLIKCVECGLQVSDKAIMCPHCGYPLQTTEAPSRMPVKRSKRAHKRLPNGFGQITELKRKGLRKPFRAMVTVGKTPEGRPVCKILKPEGYFATYNEAYEALVKYNSNPYDLNQEMTMQELFEKWSTEHDRTVKPQSREWIDRAWTYCSAIYSMKVRDIRTRHIKGCVNDGFIIVKGEKKYPKTIMQNHIKSVLNMMFDYAVEYELTDRNYARNFVISKDLKKDIEMHQKPHISFSDKEMKSLWGNISKVEGVDIILIQCYTGFRPRELCNIKLTDVDLKSKNITGGMKTKAGIDRTIPIHDAILGLVEHRYNDAKANGMDYLINITKNGFLTPLEYRDYLRLFQNIINQLNLNPLHRPHDPRKHFVTMAKKYNLDEYAIKYLVGHSINDITEKIYTDRDPDWLRTEMQKIRADEYGTNVQIV